MRISVMMISATILLMLSSACTSQQPQPAPQKETALAAHADFTVLPLDRPLGGNEAMARATAHGR